MWYKQNFFKYATATLLVLLILYFLISVSFILSPILNFIETLFFPILFAGILYYLLRPTIRYLEKVKIPRPLAITLVYCAIFIAIVVISEFVWPIIMQQINAFTAAPEASLEQVKQKTVSIMNFFNFNLYSVVELQNMLADFLKKMYAILSENIVFTITNITKVAIILAITPFILFYFLKDDELLYKRFLHLIPENYRKDVKMVMDDANATLSTFITGQLFVAFIIGVLIFIGYSIIGLENSILLALFAMVFITIPFLGSFIAIIPALLVGLSQSPFMALKVVIVMFCAHLLEANLISPQVMSQRLHIHPLIIMLVLLASGFLYGIIGLFLATPAYALCKVVVMDLHKIYQSRSLEK